MPSTAARPPVFVTGGAALRADRIVLSGPEGRHAATVRRLTAGERAGVTDGAGSGGSATRAAHAHRPLALSSNTAAAAPADEVRRTE